MVTRLTIWVALLALIMGALSPPTVAAQTPAFEVWTIDQADAAKDGSKLYILPGAALSGAPASIDMDVIDLEAAAKDVGAGPGIRPHLLMFNSSQTHGVLAYVASGHVQVIRGADRTVVASIDVGEQAHGAIPSPDDSMILVANQNGKKLARIKADFGREQFSHDVANDLDLKALEDADHPDNAPICPVLFAGAGKAYVTLRGGGLYVVDTTTTPMTVRKSFSKDQVAPAGCGGVMTGSKMFINSGSATSGAVYVFDTMTDTLVKTIDTTATGTDAHGMVLVGGGRYLWMANRGQGDTIVVIDTTTEAIVGTITDIGAAPDLLDVSPAGNRVFVSLRGPNNLTGGPPAKGETPGVAVINVQEGGRRGTRAFFVPIGDQTAASAVDPHAIAVRTLAPPDRLFFPETGFSLAFGFKLFWERNGGLPVFGFPLTEERAERNLDTGQTYTVQYLERQRFEYHPELRGTVYEVLLGRLGVEILQRQGRDWVTFPKANSNAAHYFPETGHAIAPQFWDYWRGHGLDLGDPEISLRESLALFGYPISEPQLETNPNGDQVLTQWFERARFEYHPNNPEPHKVLLGHLGAEIRAGRP